MQIGCYTYVKKKKEKKTKQAIDTRCLVFLKRFYLSDYMTHELKRQ